MSVSKKFTKKVKCKARGPKCLKLILQKLIGSSAQYGLLSVMAGFCGDKKVTRWDKECCKKRELGYFAYRCTK